MAHPIAPSADPPVHPPAAPRRKILVEVLLAYAASCAVAAALYRLPGLDGWFHVVVAALFLYLPMWLLRSRDLDPYGYRASPIAWNLLFALVVALIVFPPFLIGWAAFQKLACALPPLRALASTPCRPGGLWNFGGHFALRLPPDLLRPSLAHNLALAELVVVALPEEFFFRGYVQGRLDEVWAPSRRFFGARIGPSLPIGAALFALCHVAVQGNLGTLAVFFPGLLFGWMRARSGSILPGIVFHAACNLYIDTLTRSFLG